MSRWLIALLATFLYLVVTFPANATTTQTGSDVLAPGGNIDIAAQNVVINEAREMTDYWFQQKFSQSGLTISVSNPVITFAQTAMQMSDAAKDTDDGRMKALAAASVALAGMQAYDAVETSQGVANANIVDQVGGISLNVSLGTSSSKSTQTQNADTAKGSTLQAGKDITITARGAGEQETESPHSITIQGSNVTAAGDVILNAEDDINLLAAQNTNTLRSSNKSSSASVGVSVGFSGNTMGFTVFANASQGKGHANGDDLAWTNTHVLGDTVTLNSGNDTNLIGATVSGNQVTAHVGGDLTIQSLQDTSTYDSKQKSAGLGISYGTSGPGGNVSYGQSNINSDYASVTEQSGIRAGDAGFQVKVEEDTTLVGGAITSTQEAIDNDKNTFSTGGDLTLTDIQNKAEYEAEAVGVNVGTSINESGSYKPQGTSAGYGEDSGEAESMTLATISGIAGNKEARTGDAETGINPIFDADKVQKDIDAQVKITQQFGQQATTAVGNYAKEQIAKAAILRAAGKTEEADAIEAEWGEYGTTRLALHTLIGALTGGVDGATGAAVGTLTGPAVGDALKEIGIDDNSALGKTLIALASTAAGAMAGNTAGGAAALNEVGNNWLSPKQLLKIELEKAKCKSAADRAMCEHQVDENARGTSAAQDILLTSEKYSCSFSLGFNCDYYEGLKDAIANSFDYVQLIQDIHAAYPDWTQDQVESKAIAYLTEAQNSLDASMRRTIFGTLDVVTAVTAVTSVAGTSLKIASLFGKGVKGGVQGAVADANFAQSTIRADEVFSKEGVDIYSKLAGYPINTVDDLVSALNSGVIKPSQIPVDYVVTADGTRLILNTRTSVALDRAGIPKTDWYGRDQTGVRVLDELGKPTGETFDDLAQKQLKNNKLPPTGTPNIPAGGKK
ncbi:MAG: hemagglutinin repeat-containing protein [Methylobacillus sp.]|jgi:filamentous hemagglutinin|nr:hemagglutinin repeat-containing protein [Methylobacillus sp.]